MASTEAYLCFICSSWLSFAICDLLTLDVVPGLLALCRRSPLVTNSGLGISHSLYVRAVLRIQLLNTLDRSALTVDDITGPLRAFNSYRETAIIGLFNKVMLSS